MKRSWNWLLWAGFVVAVLAPLAYFSLFETTKSAFWIAVALFALAITMLVVGVRRAYSTPEAYGGKVAGPILATIGVVILGGFVWVSFQMKKAYPIAQNAPRVGEKAPEFALVDGNNSQIQLAKLLARPGEGTRAQHGVLLVFYRGYW